MEKVAVVEKQITNVYVWWVGALRISVAADGLHKGVIIIDLTYIWVPFFWIDVLTSGIWGLYNYTWQEKLSCYREQTKHNRKYLKLPSYVHLPGSNSYNITGLTSELTYLDMLLVAFMFEWVWAQSVGTLDHWNLCLGCGTCFMVAP